MEQLQLTINLKNLRKEILNGREYLVAPVTMIVPGVLNGSSGPLFYSPDEVGSNPSDWNGIPMLVYHPITPDGKPVTGRSPKILSKQWVGNVYNAYFDGALKGEGWFEIESTKRVDPRIYDAIVNQKTIEVSTGLGTTNIPAPPGSTYNGVAYTHIAKDYKPDHLAILPDQIGACSTKDGCGVNNSDEKKTLWNKLGSLLGIADLSQEKPPEEKQVENEPSANSKLKQLQNLLRQKYGKGPEGEYSVYAVDMYENTVVFQKDSKTWSMGYSVGENDIVSLAEENPVEVMKMISYTPVSNNERGLPVANKETVDFLVTNCGCEDVRNDLNNLPDATLNKLKEVFEKKQQEPKKEEKVENSNPAPTPAPAAPKPLTAQEWLASAPPEIQSTIQNAMALENSERQRCIAKLVSSVPEEQRASVTEIYNTMKLGQLQLLAGNVKDPAPAAPVFWGQNTPAEVHNKVNLEPVVPPVIDWAN